MKKKFPLLLAIAFLTVGCGVSKKNSSFQKNFSSELSNLTSLSNSEGLLTVK